MITNLKNIFKKTNPTYIDSRCKQGFTLAEVLITLLVIGVVASLVIPALIAETEKAEMAVQVKKYQSIISQAVKNINTDYQGILNTPLNSNGDHAAGWNTFKQYVSLMKDCGTTVHGCWPSVMYKYLNGNNWVNFDTYAAVGRGILQDGSFIDYEAKGNCTYNSSTTNSGPLYNSKCAIVFVDVNGKKAPNQAGRDVFEWHITQKGAVYPAGSLDDRIRGCDPASQDTTASNDGAAGLGTGCTAEVIKEGKIDY